MKLDHNREIFLWIQRKSLNLKDASRQLIIKKRCCLRLRNNTIVKTIELRYLPTRLKFGTRKVNSTVVSRAFSVKYQFGMVSTFIGSETYTITF